MYNGHRQNGALLTTSDDLPNVSHQSQPTEATLASFSIGMWRVREKPEKPIVLLTLPRCHKLVFLVDRSQTSSASQEQGRLRQVGKQVHSALRTNSPFNAGLQQWDSPSLIVAFEVDWDACVGCDYVNPLVHDGRVVLEARSVIKRVFGSVSDAREFYALLPVLTAAKQDTAAADAAATGSSDTPAVRPAVIGGLTKSLSGNALSGVSSSGSMDIPAMATPMRKAAQAAQMDSQQDPLITQQLASIPQDGILGLQHSTFSQSMPVPASVRDSAVANSPPHSRWQMHGRYGSAHMSSRLSDLAASPSKICQPPPPSSLQAANARKLSSGSWPVPAHWTIKSQSFEYRTICFTFRTEQLQLLLRPIIEGDERLLRLYESGLPVWAIYAPLYGIPYRPWVRTLTWVLFVAISVFSLLSGFYDLYRHVPFLEAVLRRAAARLHLPGASILEWLDTHVKIRLGILATWLLGNSVYAMQLLQLLAQMSHRARALLQPAIDILGPPLNAARQMTVLFGGQLRGSICLLLSPLTSLLGLVWGLFSSILLPFRLAWSSAAQAVWLAAGSLKTVAVAAASTVRASRQLAPAMKDAGSQVSWWYMAVPLDVFRVSGLKVVRGMQTTFKVMAQVCSDIARHRLTLTRRSKRRWAAFQASQRQRLNAWLALCTAWIAVWFHIQQDVTASRPPEAIAARDPEPPADGSRAEEAPQARSSMVGQHFKVS